MTSTSSLDRLKQAALQLKKADPGNQLAERVLQEIQGGVLMGISSVDLERTLRDLREAAPEFQNS